MMNKGLVTGINQHGENEFEPVTEHFGIKMDSTFGENVYCVFRAEEPEKDRTHACFGSTDRARSERECRYLEKLNHGGGFV